MSEKPEIEKAAPATETTPDETKPEASAQGTPEAAEKSSAPALDLGTISIGQQPEPPAITDIPGDEQQVSEPPVSVGGIDAEKKRGRGRPPMSEEAKRAKAAAEKSGAKTSRPFSPTAPITPGAPTVRQLSPDAQSGAALIMQSLDFVRVVISGGEVDKGISPEEAAQRSTVRASTEMAWATYLDDCGAKLPPWAVVVVLSGVYVAPALRTPTAREKLGFAWLKVKEWAKKKWNKE